MRTRYSRKAIPRQACGGRSVRTAPGRAASLPRSCRSSTARGICCTPRSPARTSGARWSSSLPIRPRPRAPRCRSTAESRPRSRGEGAVVYIPRHGADSALARGGDRCRSRHRGGAGRAHLAGAFSLHPFRPADRVHARLDVRRREAARGGRARRRLRAVARRRPAVRVLRIRGADRRRAAASQALSRGRRSWTRTWLVRAPARRGRGGAPRTGPRGPGSEQVQREGPPRLPAQRLRDPRGGEEGHRRRLFHGRLHHGEGALSRPAGVVLAAFLATRVLAIAATHAGAQFMSPQKQAEWAWIPGRSDLHVLPPPPALLAPLIRWDAPVYMVLA